MGADHAIHHPANPFGRNNPFGEAENRDEIGAAEQSDSIREFTSVFTPIKPAEYLKQ